MAKNIISSNYVEVGYYNEAKAKEEKEPTAFNEFLYDNQNDGGIIQAFDDLKEVFNKLDDDIANLSAGYKELMDKYEEFTNYNNTMNTIINKMKGNASYFRMRAYQLITSAQTTVQTHIKNDETLMNDLEYLNEMLGIDNVFEDVAAKANETLMIGKELK